MSATVDPALPSDWVRPRPTARQLRNDVWLAAAMSAGFAISVVLWSSTMERVDMAEPWVIVIVGVATLAPVAVRRRWPEFAALVSGAAFAAAQLLHVPELYVNQIVMFLTLYTLGAWGRHRTRSIAVRWLIIGAMFVWVFLELIFQWSVPSLYEDLGEIDPAGPLSPYLAFSLINISTNMLYFGGAYFFGDRAWYAARERAALDSRTAELVTERERSSAQAVALERLRIARELHDVVAHHVSVMGVQAGAARRVLGRDPDQAAASLSAVEQSARSAVDELRRMLGTLRADGTHAEGDDSAESSPSTRGVRQIPELVDSAEQAGHPTTFTTVGDERPLPGTVDIVAYRVAQEAITNTLKHAGHGARIDVRLRYLADGLELEVTDTGTGRAIPLTPGAGLGHVGMRERIAAVGGRVELGPRPRGGYLVRAWMPCPPPAGSPPATPHDETPDAREPAPAAPAPAPTTPATESTR